MKAFFLLSLLLFSHSAIADPVEFSATVDRDEISSDESVSLKLNVEIEGGNATISEPSFNGSDFDILNTFQSSYMDSYYRNGQFGMKNSKRITIVMRPKKTGELKISNIKIAVNGKVHTAPDIKVRVQDAGNAYPSPSTPQPRGQLGRNRNRPAPKGKGFFLRAEASKQEVYQGEQIIVSYSSYRRTRVSNHEITKFPTLEGFLREELDMPIIKRKMSSEKVIINGQEYIRELLAKYAAYPLRPGELEIDPMRMKALYYSRGSKSPFGDDPFFQFFNTLSPQVTVEESPAIKIKVKPLPQEGRLPTFSGGVGDFDVVATTDKVESKAGEPINFVVKISGNGNVSNISLPNLNLPKGVEVFETSSESKGTRGGRNTKIFKTLLIPRASGNLELPSVSFQFFNPLTEQYVMKETQPIAVTITGGPAGLDLAVAQPQQGDPSKAKKVLDIRPIFASPGSEASFRESIRTFSRAAFWVGAVAFFIFLALVILHRFQLLDFVVTPKAAIAAMKEPKGLDQKADQLLREWGQAGDQLGGSYQKLSDLIIQELNDHFDVGARSYSREVLRSKLVDSGKLKPEQWRDVSSILERAEMAQFAGGAGSVNQQDQFRSDVEKTKNVFKTFNA